MLRLAEAADREDDPRVADLITYAAATENDYGTATVETALAAAAAQHQVYPFHPSAYPRASIPGAEDLVMGTVKETARPFTVDEATLPRHVLAVGMTGAGKTTFIYNLLQQVSVPYWVFDLKTDYRHLCRAGEDVTVIPWEELRVNPLRPPPGVSVQRWSQHLVAVFGDAYDLLSGSQHYLLPHLLEAYEAVDTPPSLPMLQQYIDANGATGRSQSTYKDRITSRLSAICAATDPVFDCRTGIPLETLLDRSVVFELDGLAPDHQDFLMEYVLAWVYAYRAHHQHRGAGLRHLFVLDEGKRAFSVYKERQDAQGIPTVDTVLAKLREFGEGVVIGDQEPAKLTASVKANTYTSVLFPVGDDDQFRSMADSMQLSDRQRRYAKQLAVGEAVVQHGPRPPVPVRFDHVPVRKDVTDTELVDRWQPVWQRLRERGETGETGVHRSEQAAAAAEPGAVELSHAAEDLLRDVVRRPFVTLQERYDEFSSTGKGANAKRDLVEAGFVREKWVEDDGRFKVLELTSAGREYLEEQDVDPARSWRGGIVHGYWQHRIKAVCESAGYPAAVETEHADVVATVEGEKVAIEVAMQAADREVEHVQDRLDAGFDRVWVACRSNGVRNGLERRLTAAGLLDAVRLYRFQAFTHGEAVVSA